MPTNDLVFIVLKALAVWFFYYLAAERPWLISKFSSNPEKSLNQTVVAQRILGFFILGLVPLLSIHFLHQRSLVEFGLNSPGIDALWYILGMAVVIIPINYRLGMTAYVQERYPRMKIVDWTLGRLALSLSTWALYLIGYEFLFRGFLFHEVLEESGLLPAMAVNVVLYALAHLHQGKKEVLGAIPFGALLCLVTYYSGSIWAAVVIHIILSWSSEIFSIYHNPGLRFVFLSEK